RTLRGGCESLERELRTRARERSHAGEDMDISSWVIEQDFDVIDREPRSMLPAAATAATARTLSVGNHRVQGICARMPKSTVSADTESLPSSNAEPGPGHSYQEGNNKIGRLLMLREVPGGQSRTLARRLAGNAEPGK